MIGSVKRLTIVIKLNLIYLIIRNIMLIKNPYSPGVPLVALEPSHTQRPYSLIAMDFIRICTENKRNKVLFDIHAVTNINLMAVAPDLQNRENKMAESH